jgi:hypothetical protein
LIEKDMKGNANNSKEGPKKWSPINNVLVLPTGKEGTRLYPLVMRQFGRYCESHHPDMGGAWTEGGNYYPVKEYVHAIAAEEREHDGMGLHPDMPSPPKKEVELWEADLRRDRRKMATKSQYTRENDKKQVFAALLDILTEAGIDLLRCLEDWDVLNREKDPIQLRAAVAKTHATGLMQGSNFSNEFDTLELYNNCRQEPWETTVAYVERFQRLWNLANEYGNEIDEAKASLRFFMKLDDNQFREMKDQKMNQWRESPGEKITQLAPMIALASNWVSNGVTPEVINPIPHPRGAYTQGVAGRGKLGAGCRRNSVGVGRQVQNGVGS